LIRPDQDQSPVAGDVAGPGCIAWVLLLVVGFGCALLIVVLSAAAGWTEGQHRADQTAVATQVIFVREQLERIPTDVANRNQILLATRIAALATLTPAVPVVPQLQTTATALYWNSQITATPVIPPTVAPTVAPMETQSAPTDAPVLPGGTVVYDLAALLAEAQMHITFAEYEEAREALDAIIRIDSTYQQSTVRGLMSLALIAQANQFYRSPSDTDLAEAMRLTDLAEQYGPIGDLDYERLIADYYLDIQRVIALGNHADAIRLLNTVRSYQTIYRGGLVNFNELLFNEYVVYGDTFNLGSDPCQAAAQYNLALSLYTNAVVQQKRDDAQTACDLITPTPLWSSDTAYPGGWTTATPAP